MATPPPDSVAVVLHHVVSLFSRSWQTFTNSLGTTTLGFFAQPLVTVLIAAATLFIIFRRRGREGVKTHLRENVATAATVTVTVGLIVYGSIFIKAVLQTIYDDHRLLVSRVGELKKAAMPAPSSKVEMPSVDLPVIFLDCDSARQPNPGAGYIVEYWLSPTAGFHGLSGYRSAPGDPTTSPPPPFIWRCDVINYGKENAFHISMAFTFLINTRNVKTVDGHKMWGDVIKTSSLVHNVTVPELDGNGGKFAFYVSELREYSVDMIAPESATLELPKSSDRVKVRLKLSSEHSPLKVHLDALENPK